VTRSTPLFHFRQFGLEFDVNGWWIINDFGRISGKKAFPNTVDLLLALTLGYYEDNKVSLWGNRGNPVKQSFQEADKRSRRKTDCAISTRFTVGWTVLIETKRETEFFFRERQKPVDLDAP